MKIKTGLMSFLLVGSIFGGVLSAKAFQATPQLIPLPGQVLSAPEHSDLLRHEVPTADNSAVFRQGIPSQHRTPETDGEYWNRSYNHYKTMHAFEADA